MSEHYVSVDPRWLENPHDVQHVASCSTCGWREETVTVEHAKFLAVQHIRRMREQP